MERVVPREPTWAIVAQQSDAVVGVIGLVPHGVLEKLGFRFIGRSHHPCLAEGRDKPCIEVEYNSRERI
jgi:hypothetical protein